MHQLPKNQYAKVMSLIKSRNEISILSVLDGNHPGKVFANNIEKPTAVLIQTNECNLVAGNSNDADFNAEISSALDFWDTITPDTDEWIDKIPFIHKNKFTGKFKRMNYYLHKNNFIERDATLPQGFVMENVNLTHLRTSSYQNANKVLEWAAECGNDERFSTYGTGNYIRTGNVIVSWSLCDCFYNDQITIGITTDERYRKQGLGIKVVEATINECFTKGYKRINWSCLDSNKGSISIAETLGFQLNNEYYYFCSFLPTENPLDIPEAEWKRWAEHLEESSKYEPQLINECLYTYIKANDVQSAMRIINIMPTYKKTPEFSGILDFQGYKNAIKYFQSLGMCSNFNGNEWIYFITNKQDSCS